MNDVGKLIEPDPVKFTWGAPGWYMLGILLLLLIGVVALLMWRHHQKNKYRRSALSWLEEKERKLLNQQPVQLVYDSTMLMKRIAMSRYGRDEVASLPNKEWVTFLNSVCKSPMFTDNDAMWLAKILYVPGEQPNLDEAKGFIVKTKAWIRHHRYAL